MSRDMHLINSMLYIFDRDSKHQLVDLSNVSADIILGPLGQRKKFREFLNSARSSIKVYQPSIDDVGIAEILAVASKRGVVTQMITAPKNFRNIITDYLEDYMARHGIKIKHHEDPYIHAKIIIIDSETTDAKMYIGSCNFFPQSLDITREFGIIVNDKNQVNVISEQFKKDWNAAKLK